MLHHCVQSYHYSCHIECFVSTVIYTYFSSCVQSRLARAIRWGLELTFQIIKVVYPPQKTFCPLTPLPNTLPLHPTFKLLQPLIPNLRYPTNPPPHYSELVLTVSDPKYSPSRARVIIDFEESGGGYIGVVTPSSATVCRRTRMRDGNCWFVGEIVIGS